MYRGFVILFVREPTMPLHNTDHGGSFFYSNGGRDIDSMEPNQLKAPKTYEEQLSIYIRTLPLLIIKS